MCYSAQLKSDYRQFLRETGARLDIGEFVRLYWERAEGAKLRIPRAMDALFARPANAEERRIAELIVAFDRAETARLERELFAQRKRLADAERRLQAKHTRAAAESRRIATNKVQWCLGKLAQLRRTAPVPEDARIFPGWHAPVLVDEGAGPVVLPMRYQCRPKGKPETHDRKYPGTYNARRDNLEGFWKGQFGSGHAIVVLNAFFENVEQDGRNVVLEFRPEPAQDMLVACLWSRWSPAAGTAGGDLLSFAAITDEPPPEVAAAGHDRCIVPIKPEHLQAWLRPSGDLARAYAILDDRARPYYEHRMAA